MNTHPYDNRFSPFAECYACDRPLKTSPYEVVTEDGQLQLVGPDCWRRVEKAGPLGYQPPKGGPRLKRVEEYRCYPPRRHVRLDGHKECVCTEKRRTK